MEKFIYVGISILLAIIGGSYWLIAWCLLVIAYLIMKAMKQLQVEELLPGAFIKISGIVLIGVIIFRTFCYDYYLIPSESMAPLLNQGDYILVSKLAYGPRMPSHLLDIPTLNIFHKLGNKKRESYLTHNQPYQRLNKDLKVKHKDIILFNHPQSKKTYIKRCVGLPGDTIEIKHDMLFRNQRMVREDYAYFEALPKTTKSVFSNQKDENKYRSSWSPIQIPYRGMHIELNEDNLKQYASIINQFEGKNIFTKNQLFYVDGKLNNSFTFSQNYYYVLGDHRRRSLDSRSWGLLPESHIIGKNVLTLVSN